MKYLIISILFFTGREVYSQFESEFWNPPANQPGVSMMKTRHSRWNADSSKWICDSSVFAVYYYDSAGYCKGLYHIVNDKKTFKQVYSWKNGLLKEVREYGDLVFHAIGDAYQPDFKNPGYTVQISSKNGHYTGYTVKGGDIAFYSDSVSLHYDETGKLVRKVFHGRKMPFSFYMFDSTLVFPDSVRNSIMSNGAKLTMDYHYSKAQMIIRCSVNGVFTGMSRFVNDARGLPKTISEENHTGNVLNKITISRDTKGREIKRVSESFHLWSAWGLPADGMGGTVLTEYSGEGNISTLTYMYGEKFLTRVSYEYMPKR